MFDPVLSLSRVMLLLLCWGLVLSCSATIAGVTAAASEVGWNLPPKTTAVVTGGTKGIGKVRCVALRYVRLYWIRLD